MHRPRFRPSCWALTALALVHQAQAQTPSAPASAPAPAPALAPVTIHGEGPLPYTLPVSAAATKIETPLLLTPMTVEVLPEQVLRDQGLRSRGLTDSLALLGVQSLGVGDQGELTVFRGFSSWTTLWNGLRIEDIGSGVGPMNGGVWMDNVERLEVLKGPASILYGRSEPGGAVQVVTKKPLADFRAEVALGLGSQSQRSVALDLGGPLTADKSLRYRLNVAGDQARSWFVHGPDYRSRGLAPALEWRPVAQTRLSYEGQFRSLEGLSGTPQLPIDPATGQTLAVEARHSLLPGSGAEFRQNRHLLSLEQGLGADWLLSWKLMDNRARNPLASFSYVTNFQFPQTSPDSLTAELMVGRNRGRQHTQASTLDLSGQVSTGALRHTLLLGLEHYRRRTEQFGGWDFSQTTDYFTPTAPVLPPETDFWVIRARETALSWQDQMQWGEGRWHLLVGGRHQRLDEHSVADSPSLFIPPQDVAYRRTAFLPRAGLLWEPSPTMSAYYSYAESLGSITGVDFNGLPLKPEWASQHELGLKGEWLGGRLQALLAVFSLTKRDLSSDDPAHPGFNINVGEVRSRGFELNLQGALNERWSLILNHSQARPLITQGTSAASLYSGPTLVTGQLLPYVSNRTSSLWTRHRLGKLSGGGWTLGGGLRLASAPNPQDGATLPTRSSTVASAFVSHESVGGLLGRRTTVQLNVDNLTDERVMAFQGDAGNVLAGNWIAPRQIRLTLRTEF